jgi:hypothetical protein
MVRSGVSTSTTLTILENTGARDAVLFESVPVKRKYPEKNQNTAIYTQPMGEQT